MDKRPAPVHFICPDCRERARALPHALGRVRCTECETPLVLVSDLKPSAGPGATSTPRSELGPTVKARVDARTKQKPAAASAPIVNLSCRRCGRLYRGAPGQSCLDCKADLVPVGAVPLSRRRRWERPGGAPGLGKRR